MWWTTGGALGALLISDVIAIRWLIRHSDRLQKHGERIAWLEAKLNGKDEG